MAQCQLLKYSTSVHVYAKIQTEICEWIMQANKPWNMKPSNNFSNKDWKNVQIVKETLEKERSEQA